MEKHNFYMTSDKIRSEAKDIMNGSWGFCAKASLIYFILCAVIIAAGVVVSILNPVWYVITIASVIGLTLLYLLNYGYEIFALNLTNKNKASYKDLFAGFGKNIVKITKMLFMKLFIIAFGLCLFLVYGYVFYLSYNMSFFCLADNSSLKAKEALKESRRLMKENKKRLTNLDVENVGWSLLCLTIIGSLWAVPYMNVCKAVFYNDLKTEF